MTSITKPAKNQQPSAKKKADIKAAVKVTVKQYRNTLEMLAKT